MEEYRLEEMATSNGYVYVKIRKTMYDLPQAELMAHRLLEKRLNDADYYQSTLLFHSLAGGTGSGLGSRLIESYRDYFGRSTQLLTVSIWPSMAGETPL